MRQKDMLLVFDKFKIFDKQPFSVNFMGGRSKTEISKDLTE